MTYCVAMSLDAGMIFASDSRTNAGVDQIARFSKMRILAQRDDRVIIAVCSGNLSITQGTVNTLEQRTRAGDNFAAGIRPRTPGVILGMPAFGSGITELAR